MTRDTSVPPTTRLDKLLWCLAAALAGAAAWSAAAAPADGIPLPPAAAALLVLLLIVSFRLGQLQSAPAAGSGAGEGGRDAVLARLQHEQGILRTFFRALPDMAWIKDAEGRYLACNPLFEQFCGLKEAELIGKTDYDFVDDQLAGFFRQKDREAILADRPCINEEWVTYASDGRRALLETIKAPVHDTAGRPVAVLGIAHDITTHRRLEESLRDSRNFLDSIIDTISEPIVVKDRQHRWVHLNEACCRLLGAPREELIGKTEMDFLAPDEVRVCWEGDEIVFNSGREYCAEERTVDPAGNVRYFLTRKARFTGSHGEPLLVAIVSDFTERRELEEALRTSRRNLEEAQRIAHIGSWQLDLGDNRVAWSDEIFRILEIDPEKIQASCEAFVAVVHPDDRERLMACHADSIARRQPCEVEVRITLPGGRIKHIQGRCETLFADDGTPLRSIGTIQDVTAAREAADRIEESRRLLQELTAHREEVREEERRRISRNLHEELGQLLGSLRMALSVQSFRADPQSFRENLPSLVSLTDRAIEGLRQAVAEMRPNPLNMGIIPALEWLVLDFTKQSGVECAFHGIEGVNLPDERATALFRIVQESLANVGRHARASRADVFLDRDGDDLVLQVSDDGAGFDLFAPRPRTFGLLGMWERSVMLGGKLDIRSEPDRGTEISLRFPA